MGLSLRGFKGVYQGCKGVRGVGYKGDIRVFRGGGGGVKGGGRVSCGYKGARAMLHVANTSTRLQRSEQEFLNPEPLRRLEPLS